MFPEHISVSVNVNEIILCQGICGVEPATGYDGVPYTLTILCSAHTLVLGFSSRDTLLAWDARIRYSLGEGQCVGQCNVQWKPEVVIAMDVELSQFSISLLQSIGSVLMWNLVLKSRVVLLLSICATTCSSSPEASPPSSSVTGSCLHCVAMVLCPMALCLKEGRAVDPVSKWSIRNTGYDVQTKYDTFQLYNSDVDFCWSDKSLNTILTKQWKQNLSEWK